MQIYLEVAAYLDECLRKNNNNNESQIVKRKSFIDYYNFM